MVVVRKKQGESEDKLIARFRKIVLEEGIIDEVRDRERYKKPSERRKEKNKQIKFRIELEKRRNN